MNPSRRIQNDSESRVNEITQLLKKAVHSLSKTQIKHLLKLLDEQMSFDEEASNDQKKIKKDAYGDGWFSGACDTWDEIYQELSEEFNNAKDK